MLEVMIFAGLYAAVMIVAVSARTSKKVADRLTNVLVKLGMDERAAQNVVGGIIAIGILLMLGVLIVGQFQAQTDTQVSNLNDTNVQNTYSNIKTSIWGSLNLMGMYPWVLGAVAILGVVALIGARRG